MKVECAAILAGGQSSRMGTEKALLPIDNQPLIARIAQILQPIFAAVCVVTNQSEIAVAAELPAISDRFENRGPLGGIHAALSHFQAPTFVVACDMPFLNSPFIEFLAENFEGDALVPLGEGGFEPLHAIYNSSCTPIFENYLQSEGKMPPFRRVLAEIDARFVPLEIARSFDPTLKCFTNWNTPEDTRETPKRPET